MLSEYRPISAVQSSESNDGVIGGDVLARRTLARAELVNIGAGRRLCTARFLSFASGGVRTRRGRGDCVISIERRLTLGALRSWRESSAGRVEGVREGTGSTRELGRGWRGFASELGSRRIAGRVVIAPGEVGEATARKDTLDDAKLSTMGRDGSLGD